MRNKIDNIRKSELKRMAQLVKRKFSYNMYTLLYYNLATKDYWAIVETSDGWKYTSDDVVMLYSYRADDERDPFIYEIVNAIEENIDERNCRFECELSEVW